MTEIIWDKEDYRELTRSWNQALCSRFENVFSNLREMNEITERDLTEMVYEYSMGLMQAWYKEPSPSAGLSNAEFIGQIEDMDELINLTATMSVYGDMLVPDLVVDKLMGFGQDSMDAMVREVMRVDFEAGEEPIEPVLNDYLSDFIILPGASSEAEDAGVDDESAGKARAVDLKDEPETEQGNEQEDASKESSEDAQPAESSQETVPEDASKKALKDAQPAEASPETEPEDIDFTACESQAPQRVAASFLSLIANPSSVAYIPLIVEKAAATNVLDFYIEEAIIGFLTVTGHNSPDWMMSWLDNVIETRGDLRNHAIIHVVMLAIASANHAGDTAAVLALLVRALDFMEMKAPGARALAQLGDQRAIPFLRVRLQNYQSETDEETWHEFTSAIRMLGGKVDPAEHPARFH